VALFKNILVTGGSGFIGSSLRKIKPNWKYLSSKECDLTDKNAFYEYLCDVKPDAIIHLAARVGGIKDSINNQGEFLYLNNLININVIHQAYRANVKRVLSALSTCCFQDKSNSYPLNEENILSGTPTDSNLAYGYAKRMLFLQSKYYSENYELTYNTFTPSNIYGPHNSFDLENSHFISSMIRKFYEAKEGEKITFWGTGKPLRQSLYVDDLAEIIVLLLEKHLTNLPIIVAPNENISIKDHIKFLQRRVNKNNDIFFDNSIDGQFRKDGSNKELISLIGDYNFTPLEEGLYKTYDWYSKECKKLKLNN
tara:strand:- start:314 stop:1243 length:930 start_codon:yes stop_codon:yes gene_type:complete